jgi:hypothetical protein
MFATAWVMLAALLAAVGPAPAAGKKTKAEKSAPAPAGTWMTTVLVPGQQIVLMLLKLETDNGKWKGEVLARGPAFGRAPFNVQAIRVSGGTMSFGIRLQGQQWAFEYKLDKDKMALLGSVEVPGRTGTQLIPTRLERTTIKELDPVSLAKFTLAHHPHSYEAFAAVITVLREAKADRLKTAEVKSLADRAIQSAEAYGPRWQRNIIERMAAAVAEQPGMANLALEYARKAESLMPSKTPAEQVRAFHYLVGFLKKARKTEEARKYQDRIDRLETTMDEENRAKLLPFKPDTYKGRKDQGTRTVLVESFTNTQCPQCPAVDLALVAVGRTYKPSEVVLLEYHLNNPGPDALSNPADKERYKYYFDEIETTPRVFFNGKPGAPGGGSASDAEDKYREYRPLIDSLLERPTRVKLTVHASQKGDQVVIQAEASGVDRPSEHLRLRLALVEEWVRYDAKNGQRYHRHVVRALPGGAAGLALTKKNSRQEATVDLKKLRRSLNKYLDNSAKQGLFFSEERRPLGLTILRAVAFVQDDKTREVLQAAEAKVTTGESEKGKEN